MLLNCNLQQNTTFDCEKLKRKRKRVGIWSQSRSHGRTNTIYNSKVSRTLSGQDLPGNTEGQICRFGTYAFSLSWLLVHKTRPFLFGQPSRQHLEQF